MYVCVYDMEQRSFLLPALELRSAPRSATTIRYFTACSSWAVVVAYRDSVVVLLEAKHNKTCVFRGETQKQPFSPGWPLWGATVFAFSVPKDAHPLSPFSLCFRWRLPLFLSGGRERDPLSKDLS